MTAIERTLRFIYKRVTRLLSIRKNVSVSPDIQIGRRTLIMAPDNLRIGRSVVIGNDTWIAVNGVIEDGVLISSRVGIVGRYDHDVWQLGVGPVDASWIWSTDAETDYRHSIHIERDVWIGYGAVLLSNIRVGRGAIIAAGAVVVHDVEPYSIVAGNPAKTISHLWEGRAAQDHDERRDVFFSS
ncbi:MULTISPECIES: acyltransferase [unclassified Sulfitobacter]|uniref:acyltransferase n=1 Tax=unclassified Sulfitobacter TaxID=196795 RepID=UPI0037475493